MDELEFVQKCVKGDKKSWDEFVDKYSRLIYNYIHSVLNTQSHTFTQDNINDIFQEIFLSLVKDNFKKLRSFKAKNGCSLATWLRLITINSTIDHIRKTRSTVSIDQETDNDFSLKDVLVDNSPQINDKLADEEKAAQLKDCIETLDTDDKYFLELHMNRGLSLDELKEHLKVSRPAIDMRKIRIIERLRDCFKTKGFLLDF